MVQEKSVAVKLFRPQTARFVFSQDVWYDNNRISSKLVKLMQFIHTYHSPVGSVTLSSDDTSLTGLWFDGQKYFGSTLEQDTQEKPLPIFQQASHWLDCYFAGKHPEPNIPLAPVGSPFRQAVWELLLQIPYGRLTTYGAIAKQLQLQTGRSVSAQAVGGAVAHNPISILIPCHRVVGASGSLTGYAGGLEKKIHLLRLEGVPSDLLRIPKADPIR